GIYAGDQGFTIHVGGDTALTGAVIASTADPSKNSLTTGTLHASDLENRETWNASQTSIGGGIKVGKDGQVSQQGATALPGLPIQGLGTVTATPPMAMGASGSQSGTTRSAIANGTITITSGDAASAALDHLSGGGSLVKLLPAGSRAPANYGYYMTQPFPAAAGSTSVHPLISAASLCRRTEPLLP
ncbi:hypothetical protein, partial [uncultured Sphingomonas sp.]|uniref:hypothetical protein n=1 Tax=uncultured Sphingomonas sp. TaxID=158754 RepID=UPI0025F401EA